LFRQIAAREKARIAKAVKEKKYNDRVEKTNVQKFNDIKK